MEWMGGASGREGKLVETFGNFPRGKLLATIASLNEILINYSDC